MTSRVGPWEGVAAPLPMLKEGVRAGSRLPLPSCPRLSLGGRGSDRNSLTDKTSSYTSYTPSSVASILPLI